MALSFGDVALAFAGGAAQQYNEIEAEQRASETRMKERAQQLMDNLSVKQIESDYARELESYHKRESLYSALSAIPGGAKSPDGQIAIAKFLDLDLNHVVRNGSFGKLTAPERMGDAPIPLTERAQELLGSAYPEGKLKYAKRVRPKVSGKYFNKQGVAIPRGVTPRNDGSIAPEDVIAATGLNMQDPSFLVQDGSSWTEEEWKAIGQALLQGDKEYQFMQTDEGIYAIDKKTAEPKLLVTLNKETKRDIRTLNDKLIDVTTGEAEVIYEGEGSKEARDELVRLQQLRTELETKIDSGEGDTAKLQRDLGDLNKRITKLSDFGRTETDAASQRADQTMKTEIRAAMDVLQAAKNFEDYADAQQNGLQGLLTSSVGFFRDQYESITGAPMEEGSDFQPTTLAYHMARDFEGGRAAQDFLEARMAKGKENVFRTILLYKAAKLLKPDAKLNVDDIERVEGMLTGGIGGGAQQAGSVSAITQEAQRIGESRIVERVRQMNPDENLTGKARYNPKDGFWYYSVQDENGKISYKKYYIGQ